MVAKLEIKNLGQRQGQDTQLDWLFQNIHLKWEAPSLHVLMGGSGNGKSTLLKTLGGVWKPAEGEVLMNDQSLWASKLPWQNGELIRKVGFAFQNNALFNSLTVLENLCLPRRQRFPGQEESTHKKTAFEWLDKVGLPQTDHLFPYELSGGMQKRLSIARTLILEPDYVFLDDPTAGLDPISSSQMAQLLKNLLKNKDSLVVIVTNDPDVAPQWSSQIHFLHEKQLISPQQALYEQTKAIYL